MGLAAVKDNTVVRQMVADGGIIHVHRQPRLLYLRTEAAKTRLAGQRCQFTGRSLTFESLNPLSDAFYLDILGVRSDAVPINFNFTYRDTVSTITSGIVRYYFNSSTCPTTLVINGQVCDQVNLGGMLYSVRARDAQATHAQDGGADAPASRGEKRCQGAADSSVSASVISEYMVSTSKVITTDSHADKSASKRGAGESIVDLSPSSAFASPPRKRLARRQSTVTVLQPPAFTSTNYWEELDKFSFELFAQTLTVGEEDDSLQVRKGKQSPHERELAEPIASEDFVPSRGEESAVITDDLRRSMSRSNIRFLGKLFRLTRTKSPLLNDFIRLHLISRSVAAVAADTCASIAEKLVQHFEDQCPRSRAELFKVADKWLLDSTDFDLYGISEALALFELLVMDTAPGVYVNDSGSTLFADFLPRGSEAHRRAYSILMLYSACCGAKRLPNGFPGKVVCCALQRPNWVSGVPMVSP
ncbi:hypothetical protein F441_03379 [Phytophthora nicotianae CJ01A1]|uniref:Uncharacterized protein n=1 Tax=Phytophthora nicotianae CJ01A1 TaxID=1317063 RepID=W2XM77_PHYNI|nr:hypothetical protein F441_03379 [Phytophthora nicotianae CJ01A1]